jgi:hypothetical protein
MEKWKFVTLPGLELPSLLVVQPVASRYTFWAIPAPYYRHFFSMVLPAHSGPWPLIQFRNHFFTDGGTPWTSDQPVARPLPKHRTTQTQNKRIHTPNIHGLSGIRAHDSSVWAGEDSSILRSRGYRDRLASERAKTVHSLDLAATVAVIIDITWTTFVSSIWISCHQRPAHVRIFQLAVINVTNARHSSRNDDWLFEAGYL